MKEDSFYFPAEDGMNLFTRVWSPDAGPVRGLLQVAHGMAEHSARYASLAAVLCQEGWEVWCHDARGHGKTLERNREDPETQGEPGNLGLSRGFDRCVEDLKALATEIKSRHGQRPLFLLGHSWGSFICQMAIESSNTPWAGCILSGTRGPARPLLFFGKIISALVIALRGPRRHSRLLWQLSDGAYNKPFRPNRTAFDWLSRDNAQVDAYIADPLCGFPCPAVFYRDLIGGLYRIHAKRAMRNISREMPILMLAGTEDPVGGMGRGPRALAACYGTAGMEDVQLILYPKYRHEVLKEIDCERVHADIREWLENRG